MAQDSVCLERLENIPERLRIRILHEDEDIIVIDKPAMLRSVPGHANPPPTSSDDADQASPRLTAQEAWIQAIQSFRQDVTNDVAGKRLKCLAETTINPSGIPRKLSVFRRYCERNQQRLKVAHLIQNTDYDEQQSDFKRVMASAEIDDIVSDMYERIKKRQVPLLNLPEATSYEDSAFGQLILLGYANDEIYSEQLGVCCQRQLYVVHRLDCETSGVMVFARNKETVSTLSKAWREREKVSKLYLVRINSWPPYHHHKESSGRIDLSLSPSEERLKWKIDSGGKPSTTLWNVWKFSDKDDCQFLGAENGSSSVILELIPVTGRTHQLRVHCAAVGSGIEGDSLYGDERVEWNSSKQFTGTGLRLHAHKLSFPHPSTGKVMTFSSMPCWLK